MTLQQIPDPLQQIFLTLKRQLVPLQLLFSAFLGVLGGLAVQIPPGYRIFAFR